MPERPPYRLTVKLDGAKPEKIAEAMAELRERASEYDQAVAAQATLVIEAWQEAPIRAIIDAFETWLYYHALGVDCEIKMQRPGLRPETRDMLAREKQQTPMDYAGWGSDDERP